MKIDRLFLVIAAIYILVGMGLGMFMGQSQDFSHRTTHTHINLLGFVSMTLFALVYRVWPAMQQSVLARIHFFAYQIGALIMVSAIFLKYGGHAEEGVFGPMFGVSEALLVLGMICFLIGVVRSARE
ncbi:MAG: hypothetical protein Q7V31_15655 [Parvibaculum sp.]|uniref:hypothetical protein n=1 Tax=Parvibaculum sp. TaxID=2024848 RepID=UPI002722C1D6|nr:hypothetical protein [Parvibaculum sp.]MDO8840348.1 hypothetical protein [Parvibaculum sp.]